MKILKELLMLFQAIRATPEFVQCPCNVCDGLVGTKPNMVEGETGWFCTEESRDRFDGLSEKVWMEPVAGQMRRAS